MSLQILEREREEWHKFCVGALILYYLELDPDRAVRIGFVRYPPV